MRRVPIRACALAMALTLGLACRASDHLDSSAVIADPRLDIGDLYAWTSSDGRRLNLVMTVVGHAFSSRADYVFHIDSGRRFGATTASIPIVCRFAAPDAADCRIGSGERIVGDPRASAGVPGRHGRARLFAGLRDDPFFNNVKGSRHAFDHAAAALREGAPRDPAGCPLFSERQTREILQRWRHTQGGPARDFLEGWTPASIVLSVDLGLLDRGGKLLAVWGEVSVDGQRIDRAARPLTANALLAPLDPEAGDRLKQAWNRATPATAAGFISELARSLALYDGYDGQCGNALMADNDGAPQRRYQALAALLADDRLWVDSAASVCTQMFGVELAWIRGEETRGRDCGGRTPNHDAANIFRSLLANGTVSGVDDGLQRDAMTHSAEVFPFLAAPAIEE